MSIKIDGRRNKAESFREKLLRERIEVIKKQFKSKRLVTTEDFNQAGLKHDAINRAVFKLRDENELDVLTVRRGHRIVGWILSDGVL